MIFRLILKLFTSFREIVAGFLMEMQKPKQPAIAPARRPFVDKPMQTVQLTPDQTEAIAVAETVSLQMVSPGFEATPISVESQPIEPTTVIAEVPEIPKLLEIPEVPEILAVAPLQKEPTSTEAEQSSAASPSDRKSVVEGLLDEAWQQGLTTYAQLIGYVEAHTGKGCSKRVISAWKKARKLDEAVAA
jgi:hypothetical protein